MRAGLTADALNSLEDADVRESETGAPSWSTGAVPMQAQVGAESAADLAHSRHQRSEGRALVRVLAGGMTDAMV
jgi:hypothetical protein